MSQTTNLNAVKRTDSGKGVARKLRAGGRAPAVVYGQGEDALLLSIDALETMNLFNHISVENTIVELRVEGEKKPIPTLVREVQLHPFKPELLHVDFYMIQEGVMVEVTVPLHVHGDAPGVKLQGGVLQQVEHDLPVRSIPSQIPEDLTVDVSELQIGDQITAGQLELPEGVTLLLEDDQALVLVSAPRVAEVAEDDEDEGGDAAGDGGDAPAEGEDGEG
jgi:large subunit ribosomal protein L25